MSAVSWDDLGPAVQADLLTLTPGRDNRTGVFARDGNLYRFGLLDKATGHPTPTATRLIQEHAMATDTTTQTLADRLAPLAAELAELADQADKIKARQDHLKAQIRELVDGPDTYAAGDLSVVVSPNRRFDEAKALAAIPEAVKPLVTYPETRVDRDRLKVLAPDAYDAAWTTYEYKVGLK